MMPRGLHSLLNPLGNKEFLTAASITCKLSQEGTYGAAMLGSFTVAEHQILRIHRHLIHVQKQ